MDQFVFRWYNNPLLHNHASQFCFEAHIAAERFDFLTQAPHHPIHIVGADMRFGLIENLFRRSSLDELSFIFSG